MEDTTTLTPQRKRVSARYGNNFATHEECTLTCENNTPEEATVTETERQRIRKSRTLHPKKPLPRDGALSCASPDRATLPQEQPSRRGKVIDNSWSVIDGSWSILIRRSVMITGDWGIVIKGWSTTARSLSVLVRSYACYFAQGPILPRLGSHRMYRITRPPVQDPIQESRIPSTTRTSKQHRGQSHRSRMWSSSTPREVRLGSRRRKTE